MAKLQIDLGGDSGYVNVDQDAWKALSPARQEEWKTGMREHLAVKPEMTMGENAQDFLTQLPVGAARGASMIGGIGGDAQTLANKGLSAAGLPEMDVTNPTSEQMIESFDKNIANLPEPKGEWGKRGRTTGELGIAALGGPGSWQRKLLGYTIMPEVGGEIGEAVAPEGYKGLGKAGGQLSGLGLGMLRAPQAMRGADTLLSDQITPYSPGTLAELGPQAVLAEGSPGAMGLAKGIAANPANGGAMNHILDVLARRRTPPAPNHMSIASRENTLGNQRLGADVNAAIGPDPVLPRQEEALATRQREIGEQYPTAKQGMVTNPQGVVGLIDRTIANEVGDVANEMRNVRGMLFETTTNAQGQQVRVLSNNPDRLHNVRQHLDAVIQNSKDPAFQLKLGRVREEVNAVLKQDPNFRLADEQMLGSKRESEALDLGHSGTLTPAIHPDEFDRVMSRMTHPQRQRVWQGVRAKIESILGNNANDITKARQLIQGEGDWNRLKLTRVFGEANVDQILAAVRREETFARTWQDVYEGSQTELRKQGADAVKQAAGGHVPPLYERAFQIPEMSYNALADALLAGRHGSRDLRLARMLASQGPERDRIVQELLRRQHQNAVRLPTLPMSIAPMNALRGD